MTSVSVRQRRRSGFGARMRRSLSRVVHFGVSYPHATEALRRARNAGEWATALDGHADEFERMGDRAWGDARWVTAADAWQQAIIYRHFAGFQLHGDPATRDAHEADCQRLFACLAPLLSPPAIPLTVSVAGATVTGYLRTAAPGAPAVVLVNGLDSSATVELHRFGQVFLARGLSVVLLNGLTDPAMRHAGALRSFPDIIGRLVDLLLGQEGIPAVGLFGVSLGGFLAMDAAAADPRVAACVSLGGFHDGRVLQRLPGAARARAAHAFGLRAPATAQAPSLAHRSGGPRGALLVVHGLADRLVPPEQIEAVRRWAGARAEIWMIDGAEHVCTNRFGECLPRIGDWMASALEGAGSVPRTV